MTTYTFDFSKFGVGQLVALSGANTVAKLMAIHELTVGGIYHLPPSELPDIIAQFYRAYVAYTEQQLAQIEQDERDAAQEGALRDMLDGVEGL